MASEPDVPTHVVFDLDPGEPATIHDCLRVARRLRDMLAGLKLRCVAKTSGSKGIHLYVPLNTHGVGFQQTKSFARAVALTLQKDDPRRVTATMTKSLRSGKVFVDWGQNDRNKTTVCGYSVRAVQQPTISHPIDLDAEQVANHHATSAIDLKAADGFLKVMRCRQQLQL